MAPHATWADVGSRAHESEALRSALPPLDLADDVTRELGGPGAAVGPVPAKHRRHLRAVRASGAAGGWDGLRWLTGARALRLEPLDAVGVPSRADACVRVSV